ncbi:MAG: dipeptidase, partial [Anaerolineales bacterium]|nr:dipeptidase [Anaerolineales bacterium]
MTEKNTPLVFDGHNDTVLNLHQKERGQGRNFFEESQIGHIDLPRARKGGLGGGFFAMFAPTEKRDPGAWPTDELQPTVDPDHALKYTISLAARFLNLVREAGGQVALVKTADDLEACLRDGVLAMVMHIEGAEAIDPGLDSLYVFHGAGLRSIGPVWSRPNIFGTGVPFSFPGSPDIGPGLTEEGKALVRACNRLGVLVDVSHLNEKGFWDIARISDAPLVATHSNAHAISASPRNLTDKQLDAIGESGGIVGVNFHVSFLRPDGQKDVETPLADIRRHAQYIADRIGIEHVGLGSDFDGALMP